MGIRFYSWKLAECNDQIEKRYPGAMSGDSTKATKEKGEAMYAMMLEKNLEYIRRLRTGDHTDPIV